MGTNYYWHEKPACEMCGRSDKPKHIGKSSAGWCFSLHIEPENGINDLPDWERMWNIPGSWIVDEYGQRVTVEEMRKEITERGREGRWHDKPFGYDSWEQFHARNYSLPGPKGLLRHGHGSQPGAGTWDLCRGEFN